MTIYRVNNIELYVDELAPMPDGAPVLAIVNGRAAFRSVYKTETGRKLVHPNLPDVVCDDSDIVGRIVAYAELCEGGVHQTCTDIGATL